MEQQMYVTFLAGIFRSVRFGITESHGRGMALQFNYLWDNNAIMYNSSNGTFSADVERMKAAAKALTGELLTIQATGDFNKAKEMFDRLAIIRPEMQKVLEGLSEIPVDIDPQFPVAGY
jgi:predicted alpha/beta hydrolase family esterase